MAGNDIDHLKHQQAKLHHIRRFRAIVASPPPQVVVEKSIAHCCSIGATCVRDLDLQRFRNIGHRLGLTRSTQCPLDLQSGTTRTKQSGPGATLVFSLVAARSAAEVEGEPHFFLLEIAQAHGNAETRPPAMLAEGTGDLPHDLRSGRPADGMGHDERRFVPPPIATAESFSTGDCPWPTRRPSVAMPRSPTIR